MACASNISAKLHDEFDMPSTFLDLLLERCDFPSDWASSLSTKLDIFLDVIEILVDSVDLLAPLSRVYLPLYYLVPVLVIFFLIILLVQHSTSK